jgi:hypothetical protein
MPSMSFLTEVFVDYRVFDVENSIIMKLLGLRGFGVDY